MQPKMITPSIILLILIIPLLWNIVTVFYLVRKARKGLLSPLRFSLVCTLGLSIVISTMLFFVIAKSYGIDSKKVGFVLFVFSIHFVIGFPVVFVLAKYMMKKAFSKWSSKIYRANERK